MSTRDLGAEARALMGASRYATLATADVDGTPWATPVYFSHDGYRDLYWVSSPSARHSVNIAERPQVGLVVFDSTVPIGGAEAVYMTATAWLVPDAELARGAGVFSSRDALDGFGPDQLRAPHTLRLYRARVVQHSILVRGSDPLHESDVDTRVPVDLA